MSKQQTQSQTRPQLLPQNIQIDNDTILTENNLRIFLAGVKQYQQRFNKVEENIIVNHFRDLQKHVARGLPVRTVLAKGIEDTVRALEALKQKTPDIRDYFKDVLKADGDEPTYNAFAKVGEEQQQQETKGENVKVVQFMDITNDLDFKLFFNPTSLYTHKYVAMHSDYRDTSTDAAGVIRKFSWKFAPTRIPQVGFCNGVSEIGNIIGMRLYQPRVPYVAGMNTNAKRVSILIEEFSAQSFGSSENSTFHFIYRPIYVSSQTSIELSTEDYNDGIYTFRKPIKTLDSITIVFKDPTNVLSFTAPFDAFFIAIEFTCLKEYENQDV